MKNILLTLSLIIIPLSAMEKNQPEPFPYGDLLPELQQEILKQVPQSSNVSEAIQKLKNLMLVNTQFTSAKVIQNYLDAVLAQFPDREIQIANLLIGPKVSSIAQEWLLKKRAMLGKPAYVRRTTSLDEIENARTMILSNDTKGLESWLEQGYKPSYDLLNTAIVRGKVDAVKLLVAYGAPTQGALEFLKDRLTRRVSSLVAPGLKEIEKYLAKEAGK